MPKKHFEQQLAELEQLRYNPASPATVEEIRRALRDRNNYIAAKAARIATELAFNTLIADLLAALDRFYADPVKSDPQCWAKNAITNALAELGHTDSTPFLRGLRHIQMEPVWGGRQDTAGALRCECALALVECKDLSDITLLTHLIEAMVDHDKTVRAAAARAIGRVARPEAALLLRLRALTGDEEPEVVGACFSALLSIEGREGLSFVGRFLDAGDETAAEAALAIGAMRGPDAFRFLKERWEKQRDNELLAAIALTREEQAVDFLLSLIPGDSAVPAIGALAAARLSPEVRSRAAEAVERSGDARLRAAFAKHFG